MTILKSTVDTNDPRYIGSRAAMLEKLAELDAEHAKAVAGGGREVRRASPRSAAS